MALITKMLGIAIGDADAGRLSYDQLVAIFQEAIDNGDILEEDNRFYVVTGIVPLIDAGILKRSQHFDRFEAAMNAKLVAELRSRQKRWWQVWK